MITSKLSRLFIILVAIALLAAASCGDEPDGKWAKMKWTNVDNMTNQQGVYIIPQEGGTYTFLCRNYEHPWIELVTIDGIRQDIDNESRRSYNGEWVGVEFEGNALHLTAKQLPADVEERHIDVTVTAGDIFDIFHFKQVQAPQP